MTARKLAFLTVGIAGLLTLAACATLPEDDASDDAASAIEGSVRVGKIVTTTTRLRFRTSPSTQNLRNVAGVLPTGTEVKIVESSPTRGFYKVELQDEDLIRSFDRSTGWCFGRYLLDGAPEEDLPASEDADGGTSPDAGEPEPPPEADGGSEPEDSDSGA
jgi:hypothetical protein